MGFITAYFISQYVDIEYVNNYTGEISVVRSDIQPVVDSIPQGNVIGCVLFIIYINNLPISFNETSVMFADDFSLLLSSQYQPQRNHISNRNKNCKLDERP
jgi:hypothetical protein